MDSSLLAAWRADDPGATRQKYAGKKSVFGKDSKLGGRYWERTPERLPELNQWHVPHGLVSAFQEMAMITRRHMIDYGTTERQFAEVAVATRRHALRSDSLVDPVICDLAHLNTSRSFAGSDSASSYAQLNTTCGKGEGLRIAGLPSR